MMGRLAARLTVWMLKHADLSLKDRNLITSTVLDELGALPLADILYEDRETRELFVNGVAVDSEKSRVLRESARTALGNPALNLIRQQVAYVSFVGSAMKAETEKDLLFYRAAIWWGQQMDNILKTLAVREQEPNLE